MALILRRIADARTRETTRGANSAGIGYTRWVTSARHAPTWRSGHATSFGRYQLNNRTEAERLPSVAGSRKSSAAANSHGVIWNCPCAEKKDHFVLRQLQVQPPQPFRGPRLRTARIDDEVGLECACRSVVARENLHARTVALRLSGGAQRGDLSALQKGHVL
jgi:hypothetical protein